MDPPNLSLLNHQLPHFGRILDFTLSGKGYVDTSTMGCGKTYVTCKVAECLGLKLLIFCPKTVKAVWRSVAEKASVSVVDAITFQSASSRLEKQPRHGFLKKYTVKKGKKEHRYFNPSEKYRTLLREGILLVIDEVQFTRNNTAQYRAIQTLVKTLVSSNGQSRFAILSATPFDKPQQAVNLMKMVGIISQEELFIRSRPTGWRELISHCKAKDFLLTNEILSRKKKTLREEYEGLAFMLYSEVARRGLCSAMPLLIEKNCDAKNGYYNVSDSEKQAFDKALLALQLAVCKVKNPLKPRVQGDGHYAELTMAMVQLETLKIPIFTRIARVYLEKDKKCQMVVGVHYLNTMYSLESNLQEFDPVILHGKMEEDEREEAIDKFQSGECRLLICISRVGGVGISLHDTSGEHPRVMLLSPSFNLIDTHQATGRVYRVGTKSKTTIRMVYANVGDQERSIHRVLIRKSKVLRAILEEYTRNEILLPIDYKEEFEA